MYPIHTPIHAPAEEILQGPSLTTWNHKPLCQTAFSGSHFHSSASPRGRERESEREAAIMEFSLLLAPVLF